MGYRSFARLAILVLFTAIPSFAGAGESSHIFHWRPFLAPFHSVVLHLPIGFIAIAFILEIYSLRFPSEELRRISALVLWLCLLSGGLTAGLGILRAQTGGYEQHAVGLHRNFGMAVPLLIVAALIFQRLASKGIWKYAYRAVLSGALCAVGIAGHLGGNLTHGANYLVENAPTFVRELIDEAPGAQKTAALESEQQRYFIEKVQPILSAKCYSCHGSQKQKGDYRLDQPESILKGGKSGDVSVKPGDPGQSHLVRRILLPSENDDAMPPSGKEPLSADEIMTIVTWVKDGAAIPAASVPPPLVTSR